MPDPFGSFSSFNFFDQGNDLFPRPRQRAAYPPLSEPETESAISKLTGQTLSGLGYVGSMLDKYSGARAIRGGLGGKPRELMSLIPGSDVFGLTNEEDTVRGEDLLRNMGYDPSQGNWLERNLVGPGVELALDPATYAGGIGALTRAGKLAAKTGAVTKGLLPAVRAGERSLHPLVAMAERVVPGSQQAAANVAGTFGRGIGAGAQAANVGVRRAVPGVAAIEDAVSPLIDQARLVKNSLFEPAAGNVPNQVAQTAHRAMWPKRLARGVEIGEREVDARVKLQQVMAETGMPEREAQRYLRQMGEQVPVSGPEGRLEPVIHPDTPGLVSQFRKSVKEEGVPDFIGPSFQPHLLERLGHAQNLDLYQHGPTKASALGGLSGDLAELGATEPVMQETAAGLRSRLLNDPTGLGYVLRQRMLKRGAAGAPEKGEKLFSTTHPSVIRRSEDLTGHYGGTTAIEDLMTPSLAGENRSWSPRKIDEYLIADQLSRLKAHGIEQVTPGDLSRIMRHSVGLQKGLKRVPAGNIMGSGGEAAQAFGRNVPGTLASGPGDLQEAVPFFEPDVIRSSALRATRANKATTSADAIFNMIRMAHPMAQGLATDQPVTDVLRSTGLDTQTGVGRALEAVGITPAQQEVWLNARRSASGLGPLEPEQTFDPSEFKAMLEGYRLPQAEGNAASRTITGWHLPEPLKPVVAATDWWLNKFKTGAYSIWPGSLGRNIGSGMEENLVEAGMSPLSRMRKTANQILAGKDVDTGIPELAHLSPAEQKIALFREAYPRGVIGPGKGEISERVGGVAPTRFGMMPMDRNPMAPRQGYRQIYGQLGSSLKTKGWRGLGDLGEIGRAAGQLAEERLRLPEYMHLRATGHTPDVAAEIVRKTHFDYGNLTDFEQNFMKRVVPFYTFSRFNIPKQVGRAVQRPGVVSGPLRFSGMNQNQGEGYVPEYLQSGLSLPFGSIAPGSARYLSSLGLPMEEAFGRLKIGANPLETIQKTGEGLLGSLRPELRMPLEVATGRQFFTGRNLEDLHVGKVEQALSGGNEAIGRAISEVGGATPGGRALSTLNRLLDERKWQGDPAKIALALGLPLSTGMRVTDVDTEKWRAVDARNRLEKQMQTAQNIRESRDYFPDRTAKQQGQVTPEEANMLRTYAALKLRAREAAEKNRRVGVQIGAR